MQSSLRNRKTNSLEDEQLDEKYSKASQVTFTLSSTPQILSYLVFAGIIGLAVTLFAVLELRNVCKTNQILLLQTLKSDTPPRPCESNFEPIVWVHGKNLESGYLRHVFAVFKRLGYRFGNRSDPWSVLWSHDYPFTQLASDLDNLRPHQRVNHFPGSGYITNKGSLSTGLSSKYLPTAFKLPQQKQEFTDYAKKHPNKIWVQKSDHHRGIRVKQLNSIDHEGVFAQEYVANPLLIDGKKFDVGVYTMITSLNPLRVYAYDNDWLLRFCAKPYNVPLNASDLDSYIVGDDYTPIWDMPSLRRYYVDGGLSMKETLSLHLSQTGKDPLRIWKQIKDAIAIVCLSKEADMIKSSSKYPSSGRGNFFELVRFDFVIDENLDVYLMEANMSPNLSSAHFPRNGILYEQVLHSMLSLAGLGGTAFENRRLADRGISVFTSDCTSAICERCSSRVKCKLCHHCLSAIQRGVLEDAFVEHHNRKGCKRIVPTVDEIVTYNLTRANEMMKLWFDGRCQMDPSWCS